MLFSFIDRQRITDYSTLYRKDNLVQLIQSCAAEQSLEPLRDSILVLTNHLDNSESFFCLCQAIPINLFFILLNF